MKELEEEKKALYKRLDEIRKQEQELVIGKFKDKLNKFYKFEGGIYEGYFKLYNIWASKNEVFIEGLHFSSEFEKDYADCHWSEYSAFRQFSFNVINKWEDFNLTEISKEDFYYAFSDMLDKSLKSFNNFYD